MFECPVEGCDATFKKKLARDGHLRMSEDADHIRYRQEQVAKKEQENKEVVQGFEISENEYPNPFESLKPTPARETIQTYTGVGTKDVIVDIIKRGEVALKARTIGAEQKELLKSIISELKEALEKEGRRKDTNRVEIDKLKSIIRKWQEWNKYIKTAWISPERNKEIVEKERRNAFEKGRQTMTGTIIVQKRQIEDIENKNYKINRENRSLKSELTNLQDSISRLTRLKRREAGLTLGEYQQKYGKKNDAPSSS